MSDTFTSIAFLMNICRCASAHPSSVLLTELGVHQSRQRTVLSKHMPARFNVSDEVGENELRAPPLSRIDRPHFSPAFVDLPEAGKGCTVRQISVVLATSAPVDPKHQERLCECLAD